MTYALATANAVHVEIFRNPLAWGRALSLVICIIGRVWMVHAAELHRELADANGKCSWASLRGPVTGEPPGSIVTPLPDSKFLGRKTIRLSRNPSRYQQRTAHRFPAL
jgi:hypothetical protein